MKKLNVLWMYPDILNNYGDRGNFYALTRIGDKLGVEVEIKKVYDYQEELDFSWPHIIMFNSGELRTTETIVEHLRKYEDGLRQAIEDGKYIYAFSNSGTIFGKTVERSDGSQFHGLGILDINFKEKIHVYGDAALVEIPGFKLLGTQIRLVNSYLGEEGVPFAKRLYGYGNNFESEDEGARYKNLIYTNVLGPLFAKNPWYCEYIIKSALGEEPEIKEFNLDDYREDYPFECKSYEILTKYDREKPQVEGKDKEFFKK